MDEAVQAFGQEAWDRVPLLAGIAKTGDACRARWQSSLRRPPPDAEWAPEEDDRLQAAVDKHGLHEVTSAPLAPPASTRLMPLAFACEGISSRLMAPFFFM